MSCRWVLTRKQFSEEQKLKEYDWTASSSDGTPRAFYSDGGCVEEDGSGFTPTVAQSLKSTAIKIGNQSISFSNEQSKLYRKLLSDPQGRAEVNRRINNTAATTGAVRSFPPGLMEVIEQYLKDRQKYINILSKIGAQRAFRSDLSIPEYISSYINVNEKFPESVTITRFEGYDGPVIFNGFPNCGYTSYRSNDFADTNIYLNLYMAFDPGKLMSIKEAYEDNYFRRMLRQGLSPDQIPPIDFSDYRPEISLGAEGFINYNPFTEDGRQLVGLGIYRVKSQKQSQRSWAISITTPSYESLIASGVSSFRLGMIAGESQVAECPDPSFIVRPEGIETIILYHYSDGSTKAVVEQVTF